MKLLRTYSARFVPQNEYRLPQYRGPARPTRRITVVENHATLPRVLPNESR